MSQTTGGPPGEEPTQPPDTVELGQGRRVMSPRSRVVVSAAAVMAVVVGGAVAIASRGAAPDTDAATLPEASNPGLATGSFAPSDPSDLLSGPATARPRTPTGIEALPVGRRAGVPYWVEGQLHFPRTMVSSPRKPAALAALDGRAVVAEPDGRLVLVAPTGERTLIARDSTQVVAIDHRRQRIFYTRPVGGDRSEIVAWDLETESVRVRHRFEDTKVCCDQSYVVIRGVLPDGSVILDKLTWVRVWDLDADTFRAYPLSGASAVRALTVGGDRLVVRDEHHSVSDLEVRATRRPLAVGTRIPGANTALLSPDGRVLAVLSGDRPPYVTSTRNLDVRESLTGIGASSSVVNLMWDNGRTLLLQLSMCGHEGDTLIVRCDVATGQCTRLPDDIRGAHQLPDGSGFTF